MKKLFVVILCLFLVSCGKDIRPTDCESYYKELEAGYVECENDIYFREENYFDAALMSVDYYKLSADKGTFEVLNKGYVIARDKNRLFRAGKSWDKIDDKTFRKIKIPTEYYYMDKNSLFYEEKRVLKIHGETFEIFSDLGDILAKDKNNVYYIHRERSKKIKGVDAKTFEFLGSWYYKDKRGLYMFLSEERPKMSISGDFDLKTIKLTKDGFSDKNHLFKHYFPQNKLQKVK